MFPKQVDVSAFTFGAPKTLDNGGKSIYVSHKGKPLIIQTPEMTVPFSMSRWNADKSSDAAVKYSVELSFKGVEDNVSKQKFKELLANMDAEFIKQGMENSSAWFKKTYKTPEVVEALYTHVLKFPKDKETGEITDKYPPTFRINIPFKDGKISCPVYDNNKELIELSDIDKGSKVTAIMQCLGLWVAGGKFGCSWKVVQLRVVAPAAIRGFAFRDVEEDGATVPGTSDIEEECIDDEEDVALPPPDVVAKGNDIIESSDDEDEEDEIDAPTPPVVAKKAAPAKKVAPKK